MRRTSSPHDNSSRPNRCRRLLKCSMADGKTPLSRFHVRPVLTFRGQAAKWVWLLASFFPLQKSRKTMWWKMGSLLMTNAERDPGLDRAVAFFASNRGLLLSLPEHWETLLYDLSPNESYLMVLWIEDERSQPSQQRIIPHAVGEISL